MSRIYILQNHQHDWRILEQILYFFRMALSKMKVLLGILRTKFSRKLPQVAGLGDAAVDTGK